MALRCENLSFSYQGGSNLVLRDVSLRLDAPVTAVIGPNGAGKSTLLRVLGALEDRGRMSGRVLLDDSDVAALPAAARVRRIAFLSQTPRLSAPMTVRQSVALGRVLLRADGHAVEQALSEVGLLDRAEDRFADLSVGQRQLAAYARAMAQLADPRSDAARYLLADEPIAALDPNHAIRLAKLIRAGADSGIRCVMVVHDLGFAVAVADRVVFLARGGTVLREGTPQEILTTEQLSELFGCRFRHTQENMSPDYRL